MSEVKQAFGGYGTVGESNTAIDGTGKIIPVGNAGPRGGWCPGVWCKAAETTSANMLRLWMRNKETYSGWRFVAELPVEAITAAVGTKSFEGTLEIPENLQTLPPEAQLGVSIDQNDVVHCWMLGGSF